MVNLAAATDGTPEPRQVASPADTRSRLFAREYLGLLDYRWSQRQANSRHSGLQQLLDPGHALREMPPGSSLSYRGTLPRPTDLPELTGLYTQHLATQPPGLRPARDGDRQDWLEALTDPPPLEPTLEDSVIEGLIRALYAALPDALPDALSQTEAERTSSGNKVGRHGYAPRVKPDDHWIPVSAPSRPDGQEQQEFSPSASEPAPLPEPRPYVLGSVPDGLQLFTLRSLSELEVQAPADDSSGLIRARTLLGTGEPCFLRAQSALWSWRAQHQVNVDIHAHGPPLPGRDVLIEQKIGPVTLLLGCRVTEMTEEQRRWGFTLTSLEGQVLVSREAFMVEWLPDDTVVFVVTMQQQLAMPNLTFLGPVHSALRRKFKQGYVRNMLELTAD